MKLLFLTTGLAFVALACQNDSDPSSANQAKVQVEAAALTTKTTEAKPKAPGATQVTRGTAPAPPKSGETKAPAAKTAKTTEASKTAPSPPSPEAPLKGPIVSEEAFSVWLQSEGPTSAGKPASVRAVLVANEPYHCNTEYPHKFKYADAPEGLNYPKKDARGMKTTAKRGELVIPIEAKAAGEATVSGKLSFSVCTEERCLVEKQELKIALVVQ